MVSFSKILTFKDTIGICSSFEVLFYSKAVYNIHETKYCYLNHPQLTPYWGYEAQYDPLSWLPASTVQFFQTYCRRCNLTSLLTTSFHPQVIK